jgi:GTP pyrophosphokinase
MPQATVLSSTRLKRFSAEDQRLIQRADAFADAAHAGQHRKSGQPYIIHPRAVARYLADLGMDASTVAAGLLHDVVEDTTVTAADIEQEFGPVVRQLVEGVTKLGQVDYVQSDADTQRRLSSIENIRKLLLAMSSDLRVLVIKLADRLHNLKTLKHLSPPNRQRIAQESLDVFAPLADRLGMGGLKAEMEDLAFAYANPASYRLVRRLVTSSLPNTTAQVERLGSEIEQLLLNDNIQPLSVHGRQKHLYSIYRKLAKTDGDISKIYDLVALRVVVPTVADCYQVLGILHQHYRPLIYRIKDYIAVPKPNGYRSLHTTVFDGHDSIVEVQIRTAEMHAEAEQGMAAHTIYNAHKDSAAYKQGKAPAADHSLGWLRDLAELTARHDSGTELMDSLRLDLFHDRIFAFSPAGDLYDLPEGATPVDFAFAVHSDIGLRLQGARVNGQMVSLDRPLANRDVVEILTKKRPGPNRQWLGLVKTARARNRIKAWFRSAGREANLTSGRQLIEAQLGAWSLKRFEDLDPAAVRQACDSLNLRDAQALLAAVGDGTVSVATALRRLLPPQAQPPAPEPASPSYVPTALNARAHVVGAPELACNMAACCQPTAPDEIVGYITRGRGITVHRVGCTNVPEESDRWLRCQWQLPSQNRRLLVERLQIICHNHLGLVHSLTGLILERGINIVGITTENQASAKTQSILQVNVEVASLFDLNGLMQALSQHPAVTAVTRQPTNNTPE